MPQTSFLFSVVGVGVSLAGFSGLVIAFRRGAPLGPLDAFRLSELPEMALGAAFLALLTIPLSDSIRDAHVTLQVTSGLAAVFTLGHVIRLLVRVRAQSISQPPAFMGVVVGVDTLLLLVSATGLALGTATLYEWILVLMLARPAVAFVFVLAEVTAG